MPVPKTNAARILDRNKVAYEILTYEVDEEDLGAETAAAKLGLPVEQVYKTLVARTDAKEIVLACIQADAELDLKALGAAAGAKGADLVAVKEVQPLTGYIRGGVSPLGSKKEYRLFIDEAARAQAAISVSAGRRGLQLWVSPTALAEVAQATFAQIARPSR